ncbi:MAG: 4Fe-4S binding protein [Bacteroidetes bacterium]|nr:4Fe-4S binding protein [Bacteroidota bacterium]
MRYLPIEERKNNFLEVELGYSLEEAIEESRRCLNCGGCVECYECVYACEANAIDHDMKEEEIEIDVGAIVVATGYDMFNAEEKPEYGYGKINNVITALEFERLVNASGPTMGKIKIKGKEPKKVVFISCVGSRDKEGHEYCSRVCCMYTAKQAHMVKDKIMDSELTVFYTDVRAFGKGFEEFYNRVQAEGIIYNRRELDDKIEVIKEKGKTIIRAQGYEDIEADLVVLATAIIPREDSEELSKLLRLSQSPDGFLMEAHPKLRPIDTFTAGIFLAGCCQSPKDIPDTVAQASGAASRAGSILSREHLEVKGEIAIIDKELCIACLTCVRSCPYNVPIINEDGIAEIEAAKCEGCGTCASVCPAKAIQLQHYLDDQIIAKCKGILLEVEE